MFKKNYIRTKKISRGGDPFSIQSGRFKDAKIDTVYRSGWSEDVFTSDTRDKEVVGNTFNPTKLSLFVFALVLFLSMLIARTAWLQILKGDYYYTMAEENRIRIERLQPNRGVIYDRNLNPLVRNKANFMLYLVPIDLPSEEDDFEQIKSRLAEVLGDNIRTEIDEALVDVDRSSLDAYQPLFIRDNIDYEIAMLLHLESLSWPGVVLSTRTNREYLYTGQAIEFNDSEDDARYLFSLSHLMGYTGKINSSELEEFGDDYLPIDYIGKMGIEYFWENELKGVNGKKQIEVDALGNEKKIIGEEVPLDGNNLVLSLDVVFQLKLEEIMLKHLDELGLARASAIALDPRNGEVIAMVSLPAYNNNLFARGITQEEYSALLNHPDNQLFNRSISGEFPSGSTIKPVMAISALEEGVITENTYFYSTGGIGIGQWYFPDWKAGGHGRTNVRKAIAESVNTFFYYIGGGYEDFKGLGLERMVNHMEDFGLGSQLGVDLAGEASGLLPNRAWKEEVKGEPWYIGDTYHMAIGQGDILVTPLQVANFTAAFANNGKIYRPHLIRMILDSDDNIIKQVDAYPIKENFLDNYNIQVIKEGMRQTVTDGSARSMYDAPVEIAGKTGTAQWSSVKDNHAWFTGFAPYDEPEMVITILVEEGGEGSAVAVPIAKEALSWYFGEYKNK
ncbi:penicillin-binding protein 2 [Candidatus Parcubacteria bacterium]|nr:MAG: penicillin-binding protein 2 [Candidatus Parcubacteria bacterium]